MEAFKDILATLVIIIFGSVLVFLALSVWEVLSFVMSAMLVIVGIFLVLRIVLWACKRML